MIQNTSLSKISYTIRNTELPLPHVQITIKNTQVFRKKTSELYI